METENKVNPVNPYDICEMEGGFKSCKGCEARPTCKDPDLNVKISVKSFENALTMLKDGKKVAREGWNGKNQWVVMMPELYLPPYNTQDTNRKVNDRTAKHIGEDTPLDSQPYLALFNAQGKWQPGWVPSQGDLFANDWVIVD